MKVWIDRDKCTATLSTCESCFGQLVRTGVPDRGCVLAYKDDGSEDLTIFLHSNGHQEMLIIPSDMRDMVAYDGWTKFVDFEVPFRRNEGTERVATENSTEQ